MPTLRFASLALVLLASCAEPAAAQRGTPSSEWRLRDSSSVRFICAGEGIREPARGRFATVTSSLTLDPSDLRTARGAIDVVLASVTTEDAAWDRMFRAAPFLELDEHPRSRFVVRRVEGARALGDGAWVQVRLVGELTVRGVSQPRTLPARLRWTQAQNRVDVETGFDVHWDAFQIRVPEGWTRRFAGDHADVTVALSYERG